MAKFTFTATSQQLVQYWQKYTDQCRYYNDRIVNSEQVTLDTLFDKMKPDVKPRDEEESWLEELRRALDG